ncbi:MAG: gliding motility-associated C-terminal domain-containing protein, partial [Bacteroidota bacterium]
EYKLPNVFSPNQDGVNDEFKPFPYRFIEGIEIKIFNRWGQQVFTTEDPEIRWNGKAQKTGSDCTDGIYFYTLKVYEQYLEGIKLRQESGSIQLIRN